MACTLPPSFRHGCVATTGRAELGANAAGQSQQGERTSQPQPPGEAEAEAEAQACCHLHSPQGWSRKDALSCRPSERYCEPQLTNPGIGYLEGMGRAQPSRRYLAAPSPLPAPGAFLHAPRSVTSYPSQSGAARREPPLPCIPPCLNSPIPNFMSDQLQEPGDLKLGDVFDTQRLEPGPSKGPQRSRISCRLPLVHHACPVYVPSGIPRRS